METTIERELSYSDYLALIENEEKAIEELDNEVEACKEELEDVNISIDLAEAERLNKIKAIYEAVVTRRKQKEAQLEELENELEGRRNYLHSLREDDYVDREADAIGDRDSLSSAIDIHIEKEHSPNIIEAVEFMDGDEPTVSSVDGVYSIPSGENSPYVLGTDGQVLF